MRTKCSRMSQPQTQRSDSAQKSDSLLNALCKWNYYSNSQIRYLLLSASQRTLESNTIATMAEKCSSSILIAAPDSCRHNNTSKDVPRGDNIEALHALQLKAICSLYWLASTTILSPPNWRRAAALLSTNIAQLSCSPVVSSHGASLRSSTCFRCRLGHNRWAESISLSPTTSP